MTINQRLLDEIANRPHKPDGYEQRLVADQQSDADLEYEVDSYLTRPDSRRNKVDMDVREARKILEKAEEIQRRYYQSAGITEDPTAAAVAPTAETTETFGGPILTASAFLEQDLPETTWLVDRFIPAGGLGALIAAEKTGKSLLALDCGTAVARGEPFLDRPTTKTNVLIVEQEGAPYQLQRRIDKVTGGNAPDNLFIRHRAPMDLTDPEHLAGLRGWIEENQIGLVFIGPLAQTGNIEDENSAAGFNQIAQNMNDIISATGATIILIHHRKKPGGNDSYAAVDTFFATSRGSSALMAAVDTAIGLQRAREEAVGKLFVMQRDAASFTGNYRFDFTTLRVTPTDESPTKKTDQQEAALIRHLLDKQDAITRAEVESLLRVKNTRAGNLLKDLVQSGRAERVEGTWSYRLTDDFRRRMTENPKDASGLTSLARDAA